MDKSEKKRLRNEWKDRRREEVLASLPLVPELWEAMLVELDAAVSEHGCDHTRRFAQALLEEGGADVTEALSFLDRNGGYCDCTIVSNCHFGNLEL